MYLEEEAKTKWCPMVRKFISGGSSEIPSFGDAFALTSYNRGQKNNLNCLASECMMWRWCYDSMGETPIKGYCGLAGKIK
jgi:hypothetical protein